MSRFDTIQTSFLGGEVSPRLLGRLDLSMYKVGLSTCQNFIVRPHGLVDRRGGTKYITTVKDSTKNTILIDFSDDLGNYTLEFGDLYIRFYKDQSVIGAPYEVETTYTSAEVADLRFAIQGRDLHIVHPLHPPQLLTHEEGDTWDLDFKRWTTFLFVPTAGGTGYGVGDTFRLDQGTTPAALQSRFKVIKVDGSGVVLFVQTIFHGVTDVEIGITTVTLTGGGSGCTIECTSAYDHGPPEFVADNYPTLTWFFESRQWYVATPDEPNQIWGSHSNEIHNFTLGTGLDNEGISIIATAARKFVWVASSDTLVLGADNAEFMIISSNQQGALTPGSIRPIRASQYGGSTVPPAEIDATAVFVQRGLRKVRRLEYDLSQNDFNSPDLTLISEHITQSGIVDIAYVNEPDSLIWLLREDGILICLTYDPESGVFAWHRHPIAGTDAVVKSISATNGETVGRDELWMIVERTVDGSTVQYIEILTQGLRDDEDLKDAFFIDSGVTATGSSLATISGLDHLEGETVSILADGAVQPQQVVSGGEITIDPVADTVHAGLGFSSILDTLPIEAGNERGTSQGKLKTIQTFVLRLLRSVGFQFGVPGGTLDTYYFGPTPSMGDAIPLFTGDTDESTPFPGGPDVQSLMRIQQDDPLPLSILAIMMKGNTEV